MGDAAIHTAPAPTAVKEPALVGLLKTRKLMVCLGTGGVGKTTSSAMLALAGAYLGRKAVVLTIDPARRLADALGVGSLDGIPKEVPQERLWPGSKGSLHALMLDPGETFDRMVGKLVHDEAKREKLLRHSVYQHLSRGLAGVHEYMGLEKLHDLAHDPRFDFVVLDTPPSKNALDFLEAPGRASSFFNEKIARFFVPKEGKQSFADKILNRAQAVALGLVGKVVGESFMEDMTDFMKTFQGLFGAFEQRGIFAEKYMRGPDASYVVVTAPDPIRVEEALEFAARLKDFSLLPSAFLVNRVRLKPHGGVPTTAQAHDALGANGVPTALLAGLAAQLSRNLADRQFLSERDATTVAGLRTRAGGVDVIIAPELAESPQDPAALMRVCQALLGFPL